MDERRGPDDVSGHVSISIRDLVKILKLIVVKAIYLTPILFSARNQYDR